MNFYGDFRNPRTENRQKMLFRNKGNLRIYQDPKMPKNQYWAYKNNMNDYHFKNIILFIEKFPTTGKSGLYVL